MENMSNFNVIVAAASALVPVAAIYIKKSKNTTDDKILAIVVKILGLFSAGAVSGAMLF